MLNMAVALSQIIGQIPPVSSQPLRCVLNHYPGIFSQSVMRLPQQPHHILVALQSTCRFKVTTNYSKTIGKVLRAALNQARAQPPARRLVKASILLSTMQH